jgi:protein SCO1/2
MNAPLRRVVRTVTVACATMVLLAAGGALAAAAQSAGPAGARPNVNPTDELPVQLRGIGIDQRLGEKVPLDVVFRDERGRSVKFGDYLKDKPVLLVLAYYECPMLCTQVLNGLVTSLRPLTFDIGREFDVVTVSFDPRDTPEAAARKKAAYVADYDRPTAAAGWHFLTGDEADIRRLTDAVGFRYAWDEQAQQFVHGTGLIIITPDGRLARYFYGIEYSSRDLRLGLVEAADGRIGSPVDQVLLACFHYDPATGTYSVLTLTLVRIGGVLTLLALGSFMWLSRRRDQKVSVGGQIV